MGSQFSFRSEPPKSTITREESVDLSMVEGAVVSQVFFIHPQDKTKVIPVGMKILTKNGRHIVSSVTRNTLADRLCLRRMDIIHQINSLKVGHWSHSGFLQYFKNLLSNLWEEEELKVNIEIERLNSDRTIWRNLENINYYVINGIFTLKQDIVHVCSTIFLNQNLTDIPNSNFIRFKGKYNCQIQNAMTKRYLIAHEGGGLKFQIKELNQPDFNNTFLVYEFETVDFVPVVMLFSDPCQSFIYCNSTENLGLMHWNTDSDDVKTQNHTDFKTFYLRTDGTHRSLNPSSAFTRFVLNPTDSEDVKLMEMLSSTKPTINMLFELTVLTDPDDD